MRRSSPTETTARSGCSSVVRILRYGNDAASVTAPLNVLSQGYGPARGPGQHVEADEVHPWARSRGGDLDRLSRTSAARTRIRRHLLVTQHVDVPYRKPPKKRRCRSWLTFVRAGFDSSGGYRDTRRCCLTIHRSWTPPPAKIFEVDAHRRLFLAASLSTSTWRKIQRQGMHCIRVVPEQAEVRCRRPHSDESVKPFPRNSDA